MSTAVGTNTLTIDDVNKTLEDSLENIFQNERFNDFLLVMSKVKNYSLNNTILIVAQRPQATMIQGYGEWQKLGRYVSKGEKGLKILAPVISKVQMDKIDPQTQKPQIDANGKVIKASKEVITGFRPVSVFDVSQTEGKEIPNVRDFISRNMENDEYVSKLYEDYKTFLVETKGLDIKEAETDKGVGGYFNRLTNEIVISSNTNENNTEKFRVLIHEYAHSLLHHKDSDMKDLPRGHKEAQAESVAYVVSNYYGLDSSAVSTGYIATWSQNMQLAKKAITEIQEVSNIMIDEVDRLQKEQIQSFYKDNTKDYEEAKKYLIEHVGISKDVFEPKQDKETQLQLINKENGYILSGKLEYSEKNKMFFIKTNRNLIEPLSELSQNGNLRVLNVEKELETVNYKDSTRIPEHYSVKKVRNGPYVIQSANGHDIISKGFEKREQANEFFMRSSISQDLHRHGLMKKLLNTTALQNEFQSVMNEVEEDVNKSIGQYLSHHNKKTFQLKGHSGITVGWTLLKNPNINKIEELKEFADKNKNVPTYKKLPEAISEINEQPKKKDIVKKETLERTIER